jgi:hypothetical protein
MEVTSLYLMIAGIAPLLAASPYCRASTDAIDIHCFCFPKDIFDVPQTPGYAILSDIETFFAFQRSPHWNPSRTRAPFRKKVRVYDDSRPDAKDYFVEVSGTSINAGQTHRLEISAPRDSRFQMTNISVDVPDNGSVIVKSLAPQPNGHIPTLFIVAQNIPR